MMDINKFIDDQMAAWARRSLIGMLAECRARAGANRPEGQRSKIPGRAGRAADGESGSSAGRVLEA